MIGFLSKIFGGNTGHPTRESARAVTTRREIVA